MKHIVIGGVAGGATAIARIRRNDEEAEIILLEKGKYISYANCGLPYYLGGVIKEREKLLIQTPTSFGQRYEVDVRTESEAISINPKKKEVTIKSANGKEYVETYDKLLLSPGSIPVRPPLPGIDLPGIFTLRDIYDTDAIKQHLQIHKAANAVIMGAGFIGLEMAENLHLIGAKVTIIEMADQVMAPIDFSMAAIVQGHLIEKGVELILNEKVKEIRDGGGSQLVIETTGGKSIPADIVILSIGVRPQTRLASEAGLEIGSTGGIKVNEFLQTSDPDIYAVGDAIEYPHPLTGKPWLNYLAGPANRQGRIVADNITYGNKIKYEGSIGTAIAKVFDLTVASTGLPAKKLKGEGIEYLSSTTHSPSHAGYYPDSHQLSIKITFSPKDGKLFGAQCVGQEGTDKRIDQIAQIIKRGGTVYDLTRTEHCYAPPYSSAKDPIAIAGYVAENILAGRMKTVYWRDMKKMADIAASQGIEACPVTILDVRTIKEFSQGAVPGAINIPLEELRLRLDEIPESKPVYLYCAIGLRGYLATRILTQNGYDAYNLSGGKKTFSNLE